MFRACNEHNAAETRSETLPGAPVAQRGAGGLPVGTSRKGGCDSKNFFLIKFSRSVCVDGVGIALRGRVADEVLVVENM